VIGLPDEDASCAWAGCEAGPEVTVGRLHLCEVHARALCAALADALAPLIPYPEDLFRDQAGRAARVGWNAALEKLRGLFVWSAWGTRFFNDVLTAAAEFTRAVEDLGRADSWTAACHAAVRLFGDYERGAADTVTIGWDDPRPAEERAADALYALLRAVLTAALREVGA